MAIFKCDSCNYERDVPDRLLGKKAKCPGCGHGVTIIDELPPDLPFEVNFEEGEPVAHDGREPLGDIDGAPIDSIDLDSEDGAIDLESHEDIVCQDCAHVIESGYQGQCPQCGASLDAAEVFPEIDESAVDVSDLAEEETPQVWDAEFGNGDGADDIETVAVPAHRRLFEGTLVFNLYAGVVSGVLSLFFVYALSLLAVSQTESQFFLPYILGTALTGVIVGAIMFSFLSRIPFALVGPETVLTAVLFLCIGNIYQAMAQDYSLDHVLPTILAAIALSAFFTGLSLFVLGRFKLGEYVRYIPLQIIGGVIGGVGVFAFVGALDWMGQLNLDWSNIYSLVSSFMRNFDAGENLVRMGPSVVFGGVLFFAMCRSKHSLFLLGMILAATGAGYAAGIWGGSEALRTLAVPVSFSEGPKMVHPIEILNADLFFENIQWGIIKANGLYVGALAVLAVLTFMFRTTRLEVVRGRESDLNTEYQALGVTNMLSGLLGGMPSSLSYGRSLGNHASGGRGPVAGIVTGLVCGAGLVYADYVLPLIPRFVPEGLLLYACLDIMRDWMFRSRTAFTTRSEIWLLRLAFVATITLGILEGIGFGVALALMVTVARAGRGGVVRNVLSGANHSSNVDRASAQKRTLKEFGDHIHIMRLQGFIFLGSIEQLLKEIRVRLEDRNQLPVEYLILDCKLVNGFASAAGISLDKLRYLTNEYGVECILTSAPLELEEHLEAAGHVGDDEGLFKVFLNLDYALEWCENRVLDAENMLEMKQLTLPELLEPVFPEPKYIPALMKVLKKETAQPGEAVFRQGDKSDSMFFVESGRLDVELELDGGRILRLKKVGPGAVFGEMGIYTLASRSATIRASESCVLYRMTLEKLDAIEARAPVLVSAVNRFLINLLSERLSDANAKVRDLMM